MSFSLCTFFLSYKDAEKSKTIFFKKKGCVIKKRSSCGVTSPLYSPPPSPGLWISSVDSCVSIAGSPGGQTRALVHGGRSAVGGRGRRPGKAFDMHKTSRPAAESQHRQQEPPPPPHPTQSTSTDSALSANVCAGTLAQLRHSAAPLCSRRSARLFRHS